MVYNELANKTKGSMTKVLNYGTGGASLVYLLVGIFGFVTFAANPKVDELMLE